MSKRQEIRALAERSAREVRPAGGDYWRGTCLACELRTGKPDHRASFSYSPSSGWYRCFKCGLIGRIDDPEREAEERRRGPQSSPEYDGQAPQGFYELGRGDGRTAVVLEPAREHLRRRGLTRESLWREARIGACTEGFYEGRVVVPILSDEGEWKGFVARATDETALSKYLYPRGMNRRELLYNHAALLKRTEQPVFVVEGVMDALALWPDAVAVLGKPSDVQIWALADAPRPVVSALDGDAWRESEELAMRLRLEGQRAGSVRLPPKTDPDEVDRGWLEEEARRCL